MAALGVALAALLPVAAWMLEARVDWVGILTAFAVIPLLVVVLWLLDKGRRMPAVACAAGTALILFASSYAYQLPRLRTIWLSPRVAEAVARVRPCAATTVASTPYTEPSLVFLLGTRTVLTDTRGAAEHLLRDPACALALVGADQRAAFLGASEGCRVRAGRTRPYKRPELLHRQAARPHSLRRPSRRLTGSRPSA